ncbi:adhesin, partial [Escherichia coli]
MKNSKTFYRSALATAVIMALSGPAMADSVTALTKENPTL